MSAEIVTHEGVQYRHVPAEHNGICGSCDYLDVHGGPCPRFKAPCRNHTILRRIGAEPKATTANDAIRLPAGPRIWSTEVAGGRMHVIADGRAVVAPTRADLKQGRGEG